MNNRFHPNKVRLIEARAGCGESRTSGSSGGRVSERNSSYPNARPEATAPAASKAPVPVSAGPEPEPAPRIERPKLGLKGSATPGKSA